MTAFRVLVCGGRDYPVSHEYRVFGALLHLWEGHPEGLVVIEGGARGADRAAATWAEGWKERGVEHLTFKANWKQLGRAAGPERNRRMLTEGCPDLVLAFPGGAGTANMVAQAERAGVRVVHRI